MNLSVGGGQGELHAKEKQRATRKRSTTARSRQLKSQATPPAPVGNSIATPAPQTPASTTIPKAFALTDDRELNKLASVLTDVSTELAYLKSAQRSDGAFLRRPNDNMVIPYWGNYATVGLARLAGRNPEAAIMGWAWLDWYSKHQHPNSGFITDYRGSTNSALVSTETHDSTDAYAGTFLMAIDAMGESTKCTPCVNRLGPNIRLAVRAIAATQDVDGLTWAQPIGRVKYLMDQAEVAAGLRAAQRLAVLLDDPILGSEVGSMRARHDVGLASMIGDGSTPMVWAIAESSAVAAEFELSSVRVTVDEGKLYPDALGPIFAAALAPDVSPKILQDATKRYNERWWRWDQDPDTWGFPVLVAWALNHADETVAVNRGVLALHQLVVDGYRGQALTVGHVGQLLAFSAT
jgi:hypothetical protein